MNNFEETNNDLSSVLFGENGLSTFDEFFNDETRPKRGRKKGSKNSGESLDKVAEEYLKNPTDENFHKLWNRSYYGLRHHAYKMVEDDDVVDEITSNVYEKILTKSDQFNPSKGKFSTWMYKICYNECLAYFNRKNKESIVDTDISDVYPSQLYGSVTEDNIDTYDFSDKFERDENGELFLMQREDVMKKFFDTSINLINKFKDEGVKNCMLERFDVQSGLTLEQIAKKYNYSFTDVKNWVWKGKNLLRDEILNHHKDLYEMWKEVI